MQFTQGLHRAVQQKPDATATVCKDRVRSFRALHERVARLAGGLLELGLRRGDRICILALNSDHTIEAYLASAWIGAVIVPANFRWNTAEIIYSLSDSGCVAVIVDDAFASQIEALRTGAPTLRHVISSGDAKAAAGTVHFETLIAGSAPVDDIGERGDALFGIFYTGGTTGAPKGVMLSHSNICSSALALMAEAAFLEGAVGLHAAPMFHLAGMMMVTCLLLRGGTHVVLPMFKPDAVVDLVTRYRITDLLLVPTMLQVLIDSPAMAGADMSSVQRLMYGASPASEALLDRAMAALPSASLMQVYGMTEMSAVMTVLPPSDHRNELPDHKPHRHRLRSGGRAAYHVQVRIVDDQDRDVARGEIGEIIARGPNVMQGYLNQPEASAAALRNGWMHSGDMGLMDADGYVYIVDRLKDMIISGGENIYSAEVENAIARHPSVAAAAVIGIPCPDMGEKVHAAVVLRPGAALTQDALYAHCKALIAGYKCPRSVELRDALPVSAAGKVLKTELRKPFWAGRDRVVS